MWIIKTGCLTMALLLLGTGTATRPVESAEQRFARSSAQIVIASVQTGSSEC